MRVSGAPAGPLAEFWDVFEWWSFGSADALQQIADAFDRREPKLRRCIAELGRLRDSWQAD